MIFQSTSYALEQGSYSNFFNQESGGRFTDLIMHMKIDVDVPERTPDSVPPVVFIQAPIVYVSIGSEDPRSA